MEPVRWVHLASALLWPAGALIGLWWARSLARPRQRRWMQAIGIVAIVIGGENLLQALAPHHPRTAAHLVANVALAAVGLVVVFGMVAAGRGIVTEERVLRALSAGRLAGHGGTHGPDPGDGPGQPLPDRMPLTPRETEVVDCLCKGLDTGEIARRLGISPHTTTTHLRNIMKKLHVRSRAGVVIWAAEQGLPERRTRQVPRFR